MMDSQRAQKILEQALTKFRANDLATFPNNVGERPLMFQIAHYILLDLSKEEVREGVDVDCDYNRHGGVVKTFPLKEETISGMPDVKPQRFFPDIVVHHRGDDVQNILVCEIKRSSDPRGSGEDHDRLVLLTDRNGDFKYELGAFVEINQLAQLVTVQYFRNGVLFGNAKSIP